ncbi:TadE/TadG family type IV pilus assembly protein [Streptomyces sp. bgisy100]|uniref:TadE/TadG family type IV pilus assembly protein n=1 Tax=Streptomyces sp. bgisy100 TaxID=3413783 RepID=UPI003D7310C1
MTPEPARPERRWPPSERLLSARRLSNRFPSVRLLSVRRPSNRLSSVRLLSARRPSNRLPSVRPRSAAAHPRLRSRPRSRDRGQASVEFLGFLPVLLVVVLAAVQLGLAGYVAAQARTGARAAARTAARAEPAADPVAAGHASMSDWVARRAEVVSDAGGSDAASATVRVQIPSIIPGVESFGPVEKTATMPRDEPAP